MQKNKLSKILVNENLTILEAIKRLQELSLRCLIIVDKKRKLLGTINDGDIRRLLSENPDKKYIDKKDINTNYRFIDNTNMTIKEMKDSFKPNLKYVPVLNDKKVLGIINLMKD